MEPRFYQLFAERLRQTSSLADFIRQYFDEVYAVVVAGMAQGSLDPLAGAAATVSDLVFSGRGQLVSFRLGGQANLIVCNSRRPLTRPCHYFAAFAAISAAVELWSHHLSPAPVPDSGDWAEMARRGLY
jgi:hypothetical protein